MTRAAAAILRRYGGAGRVDRAYSAVSNKPTGEQERAHSKGGRCHSEGADVWMASRCLHRRNTAPSVGYVRKTPTTRNNLIRSSPSLFRFPLGKQKGRVFLFGLLVYTSPMQEDPTTGLMNERSRTGRLSSGARPGVQLWALVSSRRWPCLGLGAAPGLAQVWPGTGTNIPLRLHACH